MQPYHERFIVRVYGCPQPIGPNWTCHPIYMIAQNLGKEFKGAFHYFIWSGAVDPKTSAKADAVTNSREFAYKLAKELEAKRYKVEIKHETMSESELRGGTPRISA